MKIDDYRRPWTAELDDEHHRAVIFDADRIVVAYISDCLRNRGFATASMIARMANERDELASQLADAHQKLMGVDGGAQSPQKPPLGLRPKFIVAEGRTVEILEAMKRYAERGMEIPQEWRDELDAWLDDCDLWKHPSK